MRYLAPIGAISYTSQPRLGLPCTQHFHFHTVNDLCRLLWATGMRWIADESCESKDENVDISSACPDLSRGNIVVGWGRQPGRPKPARHLFPVAYMAPSQQHARWCCPGHGRCTGSRFISKPSCQSIHPGDHSRGKLGWDARPPYVEFSPSRNTAILDAQRIVASTGMCTGRTCISIDTARSHRSKRYR